MARGLNTYTACAGPGVAKPHTEIGGLAGLVISFYYAPGGPWVGIPALLTFIAANITAAVLAFGGIGGLIAAAAWVTSAIGAIEDFKYWYYNERLLCLDEDEDRCVVGTVVSPPEVSTDGDRKLNLLVAPFTREECIRTLVVHLDVNRDLLSAPNLPVFPPQGLDIAEPLNSNMDKLRQYMSDLGDADAQLANQIWIGVVDRLMSDSNLNVEFQPPEPKNFFNHLYRKDASQITEGSALWDAIPRDYDPIVPWDQPDARSGSELNPMFRFDSNNLVPYLHCEVEGNALAILLDGIRDALAGILVGLLAAIALAAAVPVLGWVLVIIAVIATILGLRDLLGSLLGDLGDVDDLNVDYDDLDAEQDGISSERGDLVVATGRWIMDTEHEQYFEIHPVRAYHLVARDPHGGLDLAEPGRDGANLSPAMVSPAVKDAVCDMAKGSEGEGGEDHIEKDLSTALSYGMQTSYGGGGFAVD